MTVSENAITLTGDGIKRFQAASIKGMLRLHLKGMRSRMPLRDILGTAGSITGRTYTVRQVSVAIADLEAYLAQTK